MAVLESGNSVELPATGYSMFPTFSPGRRVVIRPLSKGELPSEGDVVVCRVNNALIMHRLTGITSDDTGNTMFITRGDSRMENDQPVSSEQLIGVAVLYKSKGKEYAIKTSIPSAWQYRFNARLLWVYGKMKRVVDELRR